MNKKTLIKFIQHILETNSVYKAGFTLNELVKILEQQRAPDDLLQIAKKAAVSVPEAKKETEKGYLTEEDLEIAHTRAQARIAREEAARHYGRC